MERYNKIISTCCYVRDKGKVLFLYRNKGEGIEKKRFHRGIGGKAEQGESPIECVKREVKEEAGIEINPIWKGVATISKKGGVHAFISEGYKGEIKECDEGELMWVNEGEFSKLNMPKGDIELLSLIFGEEKFHAHLVYDENKNLININIERI